MTVMGERLPEAWMVEWHRNGRVEFPLRRWPIVQPPMLVLLFMALVTLQSISRTLDGGWPYITYLLIALDAGVVITIAWQLITQRPILVIDHRGIHQGRRRFMPWDEIGSIGPITGPKMARQLTIHPKNVWAKNLTLTQQHANDLQALQTWLSALLAKHHQESPSGTGNTSRLDRDA